MKENKTFIATPITEELLKTLKSGRYITTNYDTSIWMEREFYDGKFETTFGVTHILIEQHLPSSENAEEILKSYPLLSEINSKYKQQIISAMQEAASQLQTIAQTSATKKDVENIILKRIADAFDNGFHDCEKVELQIALKSIQRLVPPEYFQTTSPSFPSDEEKLTDSDKWFSANLICLLDLEKQLVKEGKQEVIDREMIFEWVSAFKEQTKNKGGKELQINKEWSKQCAEISQYGEQMLTESRRLLQECIKSFEMQGKENLLLQERMLEAEQALETEAIGFAEWIKQNNYHQFGSSDSVSHIHPNHRGDDRYRFNGLWYNTINIAEMNKPITTAELFNLYKNRNK